MTHPARPRVEPAPSDGHGGSVGAATVSEDGTWWAAVRERSDARAFEKLYARYSTPLLRFVVQRDLGTPDVAQDLVHDMFAQLWVARSDVVITSTVRAYLYRAIFNRAVTRHREESVRTRRGDQLEAMGQVPGMGTASADPAALLEGSEALGALAAALTALSPRERQIGEMRWLDGLGRPEIADVLGISAATVNNVLTSAMQKMRKRIAHRG